MAATMAGGDGAVISHGDAAALWNIGRRSKGSIHISVIYPRKVRRRGLQVHRRSSLEARDMTRRHGIPVTTPAATIVDIAVSEPEPRLERVINEADQLRVLGFAALCRELERMPRRPGLGCVKAIILRHTFRLTRSELERLFLPIAQRAGLPVPQTLVVVNGFEVDFYWPELRLVVEAKSLTYHRTPAKQTKDVIRDQRHLANETLPLHFTHWQIAKQPRYVEGILADVARKRRRELRAAA